MMSMMNPMMMVGMGGMGMNGMGQNGSPKIEINTSKNADKQMSKKKKKKKKKDESDSMESRRRRLKQKDNYFNHFLVQKCIKEENIWLCLEYNYFDHSIFVDYIVAENDENIFEFGQY